MGEAQRQIREELKRAAVSAAAAAANPAQQDAGATVVIAALAAIGRGDRAALAAFLAAADGHDGEAHGRQLAFAAALASFDQARNDFLHVSAESLAADSASHRDDATGGR